MKKKWIYDKDFKAMPVGEESFKELDKRARLNNREEVFEYLEAFGYKYLSEFIYNQYHKEHMSLRQVGRSLDKSTWCINNWMRKFGFNRRPRGGNTQNKLLDKPGIDAKILSLKGKITSREASKQIGCSPSKVRCVWRESA